MTSVPDVTGPPPAVSPYDALLVVSFGGPEGSEDVLPFLQNVTRGRGIHPSAWRRSASTTASWVGARRSTTSVELIAAVRADLAAAGLDLPVYWGNRNWDPYLRDTLQQMSSDGVRRAACFVTSAYASYSGCRQYREDLWDAAVAAAPGAPRLDKLRHYFQPSGFVEPFVGATRAAISALPGPVRDQARLVFVTHSIPVTMAAAAGPDGGAYTAQHVDVAAAVAAAVAAGTGVQREHDLVYCSRSGPPYVPWLAPDVNTHLEALHAAGVPAVVVVPIGFVSDHVEVRYDLDTQAAATAERLGLAFSRASTPGTDERFVALVRELLLERAAAERAAASSAAADVVRPRVGALPASWDVCPAGCCPNPREPDRPALCGRDSGDPVVVSA